MLDDKVVLQSDWGWGKRRRKRRRRRRRIIGNIT
jgi:hypothetical protein